MDETDSSGEEIVMWHRADRNTKTTKDTVLKFKVGAAVAALRGYVAETGSY